MKKGIVFILLLMLSFFVFSQDTLRYDTVIFKNPHRTVYHEYGYWVLNPDTVINRRGDYLLKKPTINRGSGVNTYYYRNYSTIVRLYRVGNSVVMYDTKRKETTIFKEVGFFNYVYFSF